MATSGGPKIVRDGLVFGYDADNRCSRFYPGEPTVNLCQNPLTLPASTWDARENVTVTYGQLDPFGGTNAVMIHPNSNTDNYFGTRQLTSNLNNTDICTWSVWLKATKPFTTKGIIGINEGTLINIGVNWEKFYVTRTITNGTSSYFHIGGWSSWTDNSVDIFVAYPQVELKSHMTPFVNGTRSSTQGLLDIAGNHAIDMTNMSFDDNGEPYWNRLIPNYLSITNLPFSNLKNASICFWMKRSSLNKMLVFSDLQSSSRYLMDDEQCGFWQHYDTNHLVYPTVFTDAINDNTVKQDLNWHFYTIVGADLSNWTQFFMSNYSSYQIDGTITQIQIYNRPLSLTEIQQNFNTDRGRYGI